MKFRITSLFLAAAFLSSFAIAQQAKGSGLIRGDVFFEKGNMSVRKPPAKKYPQWKMLEFPFPSSPQVFLQVANKSRDAVFLFRRMKQQQGASKSADDLMKEVRPQLQDSVKNFHVISDGKEAFGAKRKRTRVIRYTGVPYVMVKYPDDSVKKQEDPQQRTFLFEFWVVNTGQYLHIVRVQVPKLFLDPKIESNKRTITIMKYIKSQIRFF